MMEEAEQGKAGLEKVIVEAGEKVELGKTVRGGEGFKGVFMMATTWGQCGSSDGMSALGLGAFTEATCKC